MLVQLTAAVGILNRGCRCKPWQLTGRSPPIGSPANAYVTTRSWPPPHTTTNRGWYKAGDAPCLTIRSMLGETCPTARHSAGPPSPSSRCLNRDGERASAKSDSAAGTISGRRHRAVEDQPGADSPELLVAQRPARGWVFWADASSWFTPTAQEVFLRETSLKNAGGCFGSTFRPKPGWLECLQKLQDNSMLNNKLSQLSRG